MIKSIRLSNDEKKNNKNKIQFKKMNKKFRKNFPRKINNKSNSQREKLNTNQKKTENVKSIMEYTDEEKNLLSYELAKQFDKRSYCLYYISLIKTKHNLIFSFFQNNDYNSKIIKIDLFFIGFAIYYTVNGLFFDDDTMHKLYITGGTFNIEYQIIKIFYSSLISMVLNNLLKLLALTNSGIIELKENKSEGNFEMKKDDLERNFNIKFILYFILGFLFLLSFWYYIAMFGVIYKNTQIILLEDSLISFGLSLLYPFGINILPGIFRIIALSKNKNNRKCLYNFSKFLQLF